MEPILTIDHISKTYVMGEVTVSALRDVSLSLFPGEFVVILGPSGSGKSTLLNIIGGIDTPTSGDVRFQGESLATMTEKQLTRYRRQAVGFVFQFYNLIPSLTAKENILLASELVEAPIAIDELLEQVGLAERGDHFPSQLSGGQQQRVAIARAVSKNPAILLCDEPTGALDVSTGIQVLKVLKDFNRVYGKTVVIITHNAAIANIAHRVLHVKDGLIDRIEENSNPIEPDEVVW